MSEGVYLCVTICLFMIVFFMKLGVNDPHQNTYFEFNSEGTP